MSAPVESETTALPPTDRALFAALLPFLRKDLWLYVGALSMAPLTAALVVVQPVLLKTAIDDHILQGDVDGVKFAALLYLAAVVGGFVVQVSHQLLLSYAAMRTITHLRRRVYEHTLGMAQSFFDRVPTGRLLTRATSDVEALGETLTAGAVTIVLDALQVIGVLAAMFWLDARLTAVLMLVGPPLALVVNLLRRRLRVLFIEVRTSLSELNSYISERLTGIETLQLYRDEARSQAAFDKRLTRYRDATVRTNVYDASLYAFVDGLSSVTMALMLWYASGALLLTVAAWTGWLPAPSDTAEAVLTAGLLAAFLDYTAKLFQPVQEFSQKVAILQRAVAALQKIFGLLDLTEQITAGKPEPTLHDGPVQEVVLRDLCFAYGDGPRVLQHVDLRLGPGEVVAVVGRTGSGKTTLGKLLTRAYDGYHGSITLNGTELRDIAPSVVRRKVGAVRQDVQLFSGDVRFNLTLGRPVADAEIHEAVQLAHAGPVVERLGGLSGTIDQGGRNVSAGEAQLLSFARTLLYDPDVVVLDEATASVDSLTEARLQQATDAVLARKTTLVIAHRLSTIVRADRIAVLEAGRVIECGPHADLLAQGGAYATLFDQQFSEEATAAAHS